MTDQTTHLNAGADVLGADGEKVGEVAAIEAGYIVVEKGFFFPTDYYIPMEAIQSYDEDNVYLTMSKDEALNQGWDQPPVQTGGLQTETAYATDTVSSRQTEDVMAIPVHEEHLDAVRRQVDAGDVTVSKHVVTEQQTIEVPVTEERIRVEWRETPGGTVEDGHPFEEGSFEIPITREEVEVRKRTVQTGEVELTREREQHTEQVTDTVRKEVVDVDEQGTETKNKRRNRR